MPHHHLISMIVDLGDTLHRSGCPPYKLEKYIEHFARNRGLEATIIATPTWISYQFHDDENSVIMKRQKPPLLDLGALARAITRIVKDDDSAEDAGKKPHKLLMMLAYICIPMAYLLLIGSTFQALAASIGFGLIVWAFSEILTGRRSILFDFITPLTVAILTSYMNSLGAMIPAWTVCIASIIICVPGLAISNALECLAFDDLVSGTSLLGQCMLIVIKLFSGIFIGLSIGAAIWSPPAIPYTNEFPAYFPIFGMILLTLGIAIIFNIRPVDIALGLPSAAIGLWGPTLLNFENGWVVATWLSSCLITLYSNWVAKRLKLTGSIYIIQGLFLMVPGSRILASAGEGFYSAAILPIPSIGASAALIFSAIVVGQITAYAIYSPRIERY